MKLILEDSSDPEARHRIVLTPGTPITVGRRDPATIVLSGDRTISRRHFALETDGNACFIRDLNSTGGTYLNGARVSSTEVRDGDEIQAGATILKVRFAVGITSAGMPVMAPGLSRSPYPWRPPPPSSRPRLTPRCIGRSKLISRN